MSQTLYQLTKDSLAFPHPTLALTDPNGLLAVGGDLSAERLINAYRHGIFPWYSEGEPLLWWSPNPRAVIPINNISINKTLRKVIKRNDFIITVNQAFDEVIEYCADAPFREGATWIVDEMQHAYKNLHHLGQAHSIEVWKKGELIGGLYGVAVNGYFSGESMFYRESNASKIALIGLANLLSSIGVNFIDCQLTNPFLETMGCIEISRSEFLQNQQQLLNITCPDDFWLPRVIPMVLK
jgi:leucyl/phenylalanyl-tRNA--protein transferase